MTHADYHAPDRGDRPYGWRAWPLVGLIGYARTGKDSAAATLVDELGYRRISFADPLRDAAYALNPVVASGGGFHLGDRLADVVDTIGWERAKDEYPEVRRILQNFGHGLRRTLGADIWRDYAMAKVDAWCGPVVITDVRYLNEALAIRERGGVLVRVTRPGTGPLNAHASETELTQLQVDRALPNTGTLDILAQRVRNLHATIILTQAPRPA